MILIYLPMPPPHLIIGMAIPDDSWKNNIIYKNGISIQICESSFHQQIFYSMSIPALTIIPSFILIRKKWCITSFICRYIYIYIYDSTCHEFVQVLKLKYLPIWYALTIGWRTVIIVIRWCHNRNTAGLCVSKFEYKIL